MLLRQLEIFTRVADSGSFDRAATQLLITPTAVMRQMGELESQLGVSLFERTGHGVGLTAAGRVLRDRAVPLLQQRDAMVKDVRDAAGVLRVSIRVGSSPVHPISALRPFLNRVTHMHPEYGFDAVYFDETTDGSPESLPAMGEGCAFDCVAGACACESGTDGLGFLKLADVPFRLAAPAGHGLASRETVSLADLSGECVLMAGAGRIPQVDMVREELVRRVPDIEIVDSPACFYDGRALDMVTQLNALLLTLDMWDGLHPSFVTLPVRWSHAIPYGILYPRGAGESMRDFLVAVEEAADGEDMTFEME